MLCSLIGHFYSLKINLNHVFRFSLLGALILLFLVVSCVEKDKFSIEEEQGYSIDNSTSLIPTEFLSYAFTAKGRVDSNLFDIEVLEPKIRDRVDRIKAKYSKSDEFNVEDTGYPLWGAIMSDEGVSVIPTVRLNSNISYEFIMVQEIEGQEPIFSYSNVLSSEKVVSLVSTLTYRILTEESRQEVFQNKNATLQDIFVEDENGGSASCLPFECTTVTFVQEICLSATLTSTGETLCCKCEIDVTRNVVCSGGGGSGGNGGGPSGGGGGGGGTGGTGGNSGSNPSIDRYIAYLDSLRNQAPDQIINNVDCAQDPCLCEVVEMFSGDPNIFENLSNEVSQLIHEIFNIPNYQHITITTTDVEGTTMDSGDMAIHGLGVNGPPGFNFPLTGFGHSVITFNSDFGLNCTQAHLAATLLHESMHAYIDVQREALYPVDFDRLYPLYSTAFDPNEEGHYTMANRFIGELKRSLHTMFPDLTDEFLEALTWQGLERTPGYRALIRTKPDGFEARMQQINNIASCQGDPNFPATYSPAELDAMGLVSCF